MSTALGVMTRPWSAPEPEADVALVRVLVVVPTYCEADNIVTLLNRVRAAIPAADILVVDDSSEDGTAALAGSVGEELGQIRVLHHGAKQGLGAAYRSGFAYGIARDYDVLIEMDADLSHDPAALPLLLEALDRGADLAIGSRYVHGADIPAWTARRRALSKYGNRYASRMLTLAPSDLTSGYRAFRSSALIDADYATSRATGYAFQIELARRVAKAGGSISEVPIVFHDRNTGTSKMSTRITVEALALVTWWGIQDRWRRLRPSR